MPKKYAIRSPRAVLNKLKTDLRLRKATTEFREQYRNLVHLRIGKLVDVGSGYSQFHIIDTPENREALEIAYSLVTEGIVSGLEIDEDARLALQHDQKYVESLVAASELRKREAIILPEEEQDELERLLLAGGNL